VYDLEECELCYEPPFGSAKDPINFAGMVGAGVLRGDMPVTHWNSAEDRFLLDVREKVEQAVEQVPEAVNIPLGEPRARLGELPRDREIGVIGRSGQRAYYATRLVLQHGFDAKVISGGMLSHAILAPPLRQEILRERRRQRSHREARRRRRCRGLHSRADRARRGGPVGRSSRRAVPGRHPDRTRPP
jgi:rhodanese-related sulfurtransferase